MPRDHRLDGQAFTCGNSRYHTDTEAGLPHGEGQAGGSVFAEPLLETNGYTLWLEYVRAKDGAKVFWLMWYNPAGEPTIPMSGVMSADEVAVMTGRLTRFAEIR